MGRHSLPLEDTVRGEIYQVYLDYAETHSTVPNSHAFWEKVVVPAGYSISWSTFRVHWRELQYAGLIKIDKKTGSIIADGLDIKKKEA